MQKGEGVSQHTVSNILTRDFVLGFLALFAFIAASYTLIPTLPIYFENLGSNVTEIGVLVGAFAASSLVFRLFVGRALLRYSEKSIMMFGAMLFAVTFLACIVFSPFWPFFAVRVLQGIAFACVDTAALAFIINVTPPAHRGQVIGYILMAPNIALALAPSFGMLVINHFNFIILFLFGMGLSLCAFVVAWRLRDRQPVASGDDAPASDAPFLEWKVIVPGVTAFLHNCIWGALITFVPLYARQCGIANPGHFFSASAIMLIAGRSLGGRILNTYSKEKLIMTVIFTSMVAMVILSFSTSLSMLIVVGLLFGIGSAFLYPAAMAYAFEYAGSSAGTAVGTIRALMDLGIALGPVIMGIILPLTSYRTMFLCVALICVINLTYFQFYVRRKRNHKEGVAAKKVPN
jgi:MFS family permease